MLLINVKIAWRNLFSNKGYSLLNVFGLSIGLTVAILIGLWIYDEISYDDYFENKDRIGQVLQQQLFSGKIGTGPSIPRPLEKVLREEYKDYFEHLLMSSWQQGVFLKHEEINLSAQGLKIQPGAPELLSLEIEKGVLRGLEDVHSIMLSASLATSLFGEEDPVGKTVKVNAKTDVKVTAVYKDLPDNTSFKDVKYLLPWEFFVRSTKWVIEAENAWHNNSFQLFVQLAEGVSFEDVDIAIKDVKKNKLKSIGDTTDFKPELFVHKMSDWRLHNDFENGEQTGGLIKLVWTLGLIGGMVIFLACINFMNLSTARSEKRAKEVGIKKTLGATRKQLISQFFSETFFVVLSAAIIAILMVFILIKPFNMLADKAIEMPVFSGLFWSILFIVIGVTTLLSGSYPALFLSKFKPAQVIKGIFTGKNSNIVRQLLVVFQFVISIVLMVLVLVVKNQLHFVQNRAVGYDKSALVQFVGDTKPFWGNYESLRGAFLKSGAVEVMTCGSSPATAVYSNRSFISWKGIPDGFNPDFAWVEVGFEYVETLKLKVIKGRGFSRELASDSSAVLINESAAKYMGLNDPIGEFITMDGQNIKLKIIGIVEDMVMSSPFEPVKQTLYPFNRWGGGNYILRLNKENTIAENLEILEDVFKERLPEVPFDIEFVDQIYANKFKQMDRLFRLLFIGAGLAIFISCLGLFGLTSFITQQRTKEIGVRKSIGASVFKIWRILCKDFVVLIIISAVIAIPIAFFISRNWINDYKYRADISSWHFIIGIVMAIVITLITVSYHAIRAAKIDPIKSLKTE